MPDNFLHLYETGDIEIVRADDCYLFSSNNKQIVDFESGVWCVNLGHCNKRINAVMHSQIDSIVHLGYRFGNKLPNRLSEILLQRLNFINGKSVFLSSGSEAVNLAISFAKQITGCSKILTIGSSYLSAYGHGMSVDTNQLIVKIPINNYTALTSIDFSDIAAFVFVPGTAGAVIDFAELDFIHQICALIKSNNKLLVIDEVTSGFGRTGKWFGYEHYAIQPDIVALGKALGNGYPVSAVCVNSETGERIENLGIVYAQSHQNDPLGCAIGLEVMAVIEDEQLIARSESVGSAFKNMLVDLHQRFTQITDVRGKGLMLALELESADLARCIYQKLYESGFYVGIKNRILRFMPPLTITLQDIKLLVNRIEQILTNEL